MRLASRRSLGGRSPAQACEPGGDAVYPGRSDVVDDSPVGKEHHPIRIRGCHRIVGDHHDCLMVGVHRLAQQPKHVGCIVAVERPCGLVTEDHVRTSDQCPSNCDPLLLASGKLARTMTDAIFQSDLLDDLLRPMPLPADMREAQREQDVFPDVQGRDEVERLKDETDPGSAELGHLRLGKAAKVVTGQTHNPR